MHKQKHAHSEQREAGAPAPPSARRGRRAPVQPLRAISADSKETGNMMADHRGAAASICRDRGTSSNDFLPRLLVELN